jgi:acetylornithine deacetylase/succinyl-diaminopimelate desuccinylase-like protein
MLQRAIDRQWNESVLDQLHRFIQIPNKSPIFDPEWESHGHMERAVQLIVDWCRAQPLPGMQVEVHRLPGMTPLIFVDIPGERSDCVVLYGHLDKQPEFTGWLPGLSAWEPVLRDGRLYGRGGADDGYAVYSAIGAILALKQQKVPLARCVLLVEASEESGSVDLPSHLEGLGARIGNPSLVICLDAGCSNYDQLWCTTSLRGNITGRLSVRVLKHGVHSGGGTGIAPAPFRIVQQLLARLEDPKTGHLLPEELQVSIADERREQIRAAAQALGPLIAAKLPFAGLAQPVSNDPVELLTNNTWRATLTVTGADGLPGIASAGNVLLPEIALKLSFRLPPTCDPLRAAAAVRSVLEAEPPYDVEVKFEVDNASAGWDAPAIAPWLDESINTASRKVFGRDAIYVGAGGSIPFLGMLGERFAQTQFLVTGVLGPLSNAHGPNEFLHINYAKRLTACVAQVLADHGARTRSP